ncbi:MAG TPA: methyltransferase domain-containing protein [Casimicrobiaceae bacterium]|nr:methyltransferase domain-containing protein [Casimicrobiaceae bacterium]
MTWNPAQYLKYESQRLRPAIDLIARIPLAAPATIVDLGCGAGNVARVLADRFAGATVDGVDSDAAMLARAREETAADPRFRWTEADLAGWHPPYPVDVIFSNAALHWVDGHEALFPALVRKLAPHGVLAVQMPDNHAAASHVALFETARMPRWRARAEPLMRTHPVAALDDYYAWLAPVAHKLDLWRTTYLQPLVALPGAEHPVVAWMRGAALTPYLAALGDDAEAFVAEFAARVEVAYPRRGDGIVLFPFARVFIVVQRGA